MKKKLLEARKKRVRIIIRELKKLFPNAGMVLHYSNNWELMVAVVLSAQCTDKMVNKVTTELFKKYTTLADYVNADIKVFEQDIKSTGFYKNKAKNVLAAARMLKEDFNGKIPATMEQLITLPGVGRKTANVVLGNAYGVVEGIAVDTHVKRLSKKFNLTDNSTPEKIEQDLMAIMPKKHWFEFTYLLIEYGRNYSPARKFNDNTDPISLILA
ncbi:MAG: endonuclease III [Candidatus Jacksonbacteria bacterium]|jgi:endonuclease III|nr:endonuclease III [Candidatus Jacksonbacteria bacterium]MBT6034417.1 endonuclease III [Candidatus Jacksonbacteria bacterium]MBT6301662.1 endonuclease III [Candidatus Jacksonbacteria bacterium]MBT6757449.1 endonuclease III [Candidatus Jacksonbacteria bacterium]MBT6954971.1 endonuclease III [Candidatus Jacksonbacteria bacterium]